MPQLERISDNLVASGVALMTTLGGSKQQIHDQVMEAYERAMLEFREARSTRSAAAEANARVEELRTRGYAILDALTGLDPSELASLDAVAADRHAIAVERQRVVSALAAETDALQKTEAELSAAAGLVAEKLDAVVSAVTTNQRSNAATRATLVSLQRALDAIETASRTTLE